jgi:hypothetical protein
MHRGSSFFPAVLVLLATASGAAAAPDPTPLDTGLLSPLSVAVAADGGVWYSENYAGLLHHRDPDGTVTTPVRAPGELELSAVSELDGTVWYAVTGAGHTIGRLHERTTDARGRATDTVVSDLYDHERRTDPDHSFRYGFRDLPPDCAARLPRGGRAAYRGRAETHPVASLPAHGAVYVADAAANAVVAVAAGTATTVVALPPVRTTMSRAYAEENHFPACTVGRDYWAEAVPTDVEAGPDASLYVTSLPGGPGRLHGEPAGRLLRILILTGRVTVVADGLDSPVGLAVAATGDVYVSELQADRISRVEAGTSTLTPYAHVTFPGDLEWTPDGLVATTDVLSGTNGVDPPEGRLVRLN